MYPLGTLVLCGEVDLTCDEELMQGSLNISDALDNFLGSVKSFFLCCFFSVVRKMMTDR